MAGSTIGIVMIVVASVVGLIALEVMVLVAAERPYFKHPRPDPMQSKVRGGIHLGDPRSAGAPEQELVRDAVEAPEATAAGAAPEPRAPEPRPPVGATRAPGARPGS